MRAAITVILLLLVNSFALAQTPKTFVFVKINEPLMPTQRDAKYATPLSAQLKKERIGEITGAGSMLSKEGKLMWTGLDIELESPDTGIPALRRILTRLGAPKGSTIEYTTKGRKVEVPISE